MDAKTSAIDRYANRRQMPRVVIPEVLKNNSSPIVLVSGNLDYYVRYGLPLIKSFTQNSTETALIVNCVDFSIGLATSLLNKHREKKKNLKIYFSKTQLSSLGAISQERKVCYLKTIRYYVGLKIMELSQSNLIIADIDALFTRPTFDRDFKNLITSNVSFGVGSTYDFLGNSLFESRQQNFVENCKGWFYLLCC